MALRTFAEISGEQLPDLWTHEEPRFEVGDIADQECFEEIAKLAVGAYDAVPCNALRHTLPRVPDVEPDGQEVIIRFDPGNDDALNIKYSDGERLIIRAEPLRPYRESKYSPLRFKNLVHVVPVESGIRSTEIKDNRARTVIRGLVPSGNMFREDRLHGYSADYVADAVASLQRASRIQVFSRLAAA